MSSMSQMPNTRRRWLRFSIRDVGFATALCAVCLGWWADRYYGTLNNEPSEIFAAFDIVQLLGNAGFDVEEHADSERTTNSASGRAQLIDAGTFAAPADDFTCFNLYQLVTKRLNTASDNHSHQEGWIPTAELHPVKPVRICTFYNQGKRHGEFHLWLFPNHDESRVGYALYLEEVPLR
jgi:hypothetical protein